MKGQNLRLFVNNKCIALATSCTYHVSLEMEEASTKDDTANFGKSEPVGANWDFSCDALYSPEADSGAHNGEDALDIVLAQAKVWVEFERTGGTKNRDEVNGTPNTYGGWAYVNDISVNAPNRQNVTYTIQGTGWGELKKNPTTSSSAL